MSRRAVNKKNSYVKVLDASQKFQIKESYNMARANIMFSIIKEGCKKIVITSPGENEGKSTLAQNLAISFAKQDDTKVLLIDCDLRRPSVARKFNFKNDPGLTNYIGGLTDYRSIVHHTDIENLDVITGGTVPPNPSEILASHAMAKMIQAEEQRYDYIIIDTPPINVVSDAIYCAKNCDGVVLVARELKTTHTELASAVSSLKFIDAKILGLVMTGVVEDSKNFKKSSGQRRGYEYGYYYHAGREDRYFNNKKD